MRKKILLLISALLMSGCTPLMGGPSICDDRSTPSLLCDMAEDTGIRLEDAGRALIMVNDKAISSGKYTGGQAVKALTDLRAFLDNPVTYLVFRTALEDAMAANPELFVVASIYTAYLNKPDIMHKLDQELLTAWLDNCIRGLEGGS